MTGMVLPGSDRPWSGGVGSERAFCVLAPNPSPMTLDGTNTWLLSEPGATSCIVVDPGPDDDAHLDAIIAAADARSQRIALTVLTHGHPDHAEGARHLAERTNTAVRALDPMHRYGSEGLASGDVIELDGLELRVVETPGHTGDCVSFHLPADGALLTGDTVLGRGTSVIAWPDGRLGAYLVSLVRLRDLAERSDAGVLLPGHGPTLDDPARVLAEYLTHRGQRLDQVRDAIRAGITSAPAIVDALYEIPDALKFAAELSVRAQLQYLAELGEV